MKKFIIACTSAALLSAPAMAATDGRLSSKSSVGTLEVTTTVPKLVRISGLSDINFPITADQLSNTAGRQNQAEKFCVFSNDTVDGLYSIAVDGTASGEFSESKYALTGDNGTRLNYAVWVSDNVNNLYGRGTANPGTAMTAKTTAGGLARPTTIDCSGNDNTAVNIGIYNSKILAALAGKYTGTLTFTVSTL